MFEDLLEIYKKKAANSEKELEETQAMIGLIMAVENMSNMLTNKQQDVDLLGRLIDQVDHLSKEVADLKGQIKARQIRTTTNSELVDMLGLNKTTVISVMKRAVDMDPAHVKLTQGKRRKLYLSYTPDEEGDGEKGEPDSDGEGDKARLELMAMT